MLALEIMAERAASPITVQALFETPKLWAKARGAADGSATSAAPKLRSPFRSLSPSPISSIAVRHRALSRRPARRPLRDAALYALLIQELTGAHAVRPVDFGERVPSSSTPSSRFASTRDGRSRRVRRQYPQYAAALEARFLRQSAMRRDLGRYDALFQEGLSRPRSTKTSRERRGKKGDAAPFRPRPRYARIDRALDLFADLNDQQLERVQKLLKARSRCLAS